MSILLAIYLLGVGTTAGYGVGTCSGHAIGCEVVVVAASPIWPITVGAAVVEKIIK